MKDPENILSDNFFSPDELKLILRHLKNYPEEKILIEGLLKEKVGDINNPSMPLVGITIRINKKGYFEASAGASQNFDRIVDQTNTNRKEIRKLINNYAHDLVHDINKMLEDSIDKSEVN